MTLVHKLNVARNIFLAYARRRKCDRPNKAIEAVQIADAIESALERITLLETQLRNANDAVAALVADDKALRQQVADLQTSNAAKDQTITALEANAITPETLAAVNELVPEPVVLTATPVDPATASA